MEEGLRPAQIHPHLNVEVMLPRQGARIAPPAALPGAPVIPLSPPMPESRLSIPRAEPVKVAPAAAPELPSIPPPAQRSSAEPQHTTVVAVPAIMRAQGSPRLGTGTPHIGLGQL
jgi:hypothetical protein